MRNDSSFNKLNRYQKKKSGKRSDELPVKLISREEVSKATEEYLKRGGKITKISGDDFVSRKLSDIDRFGFHEAYNFLNGE